MATKKYKLDIAKSYSFDRLTKNLESLKHTIENQVLETFVKETFWYIIDKANEYLDKSDTYQPMISKIRTSWQYNYKIVGGVANIRIENTSEVGVYVEFGTGIVGQRTPHPKTNDNKYIYDMNHHGEKGWTFYVPELNMWFHGFDGYRGKRFLYNAVFDYYEKGQYLKIYNDAYKKYIHR